MPGALARKVRAAASEYPWWGYKRIAVVVRRAGVEASNVPLADGIPIDDTIARIISALSVSGFQECFLSWMEDMVKLSDGEFIVLDGKTHRRSHDRKRGVNALHMVSGHAAMEWCLDR